MNEPQIPDIEGTAKKLTDTFDKMKPVLEAIEKMDAMGIPVADIMTGKLKVPPNVGLSKPDSAKTVKMSDPVERYDLSQGLHIPNKYFEEATTYSEDMKNTYVLVAQLLTDGDEVEFDEDSHEIIFEMGGKTWNFCLITECCQVKVLSIVFRSLHDLIEGGELVYNPKG